MRPLPIDPLVPGIIDGLRGGSRLVLRAPPGAGKTTRVPAALLDAGIAGERQLVVLEPRRIAARAAAEYVATERGGQVGDEIGYQVRFERQGGRRTRLWFLTEGVFSRRLPGDPFLEEIGVVVLDEFHERHLQADVALGVVRELQETVRPDLRLVVMSATLDTAKVAAFLGDCPVLTSEGRAFPVEIEHVESPERRLETRIATAFARETAAGTGGDVLVFLPGAAAIRRAGEAIASSAEAKGIDVVPLHGELPLDAQKRALLPGRRRKVVLSTNVAETALTIEGVTTVIDSGLAREARFDPRHGMNRLEEVRISRAAAEQRAGRAGRTRPGRCVRLWGRADHEGRKERELPEILRLDLAATVLELRAWGTKDVRSFPWLDPPGEGALESAERLLLTLGAVDSTQAVTDTGRRMLELSAPPRLARMLIEAERRGCASAGALLAALASERDILLERRALSGRSDAPWPAGPSDLLLRLELFDEAERRGFRRDACEALGLDERTARTVDRSRRQLARAIGGREGGDRDPEALLRCVLAGFPDRVVRRREPGSPRGRMMGGKGVILDPASVVREEELFVAVDIDAGPRGERSEGRVRLASAVRREWLGEMQSLRTTRDLVFDPAGERVVERERELYQDLVLRDSARTDVDRAAAGVILALEARRDPERALTPGSAARAVLDRIRFLSRAMPELAFPDLDALLGQAIDALTANRSSFAEIRKGDLAATLVGLLEWKHRDTLEREAPEQFRLPGGRHAPVRYEPDRPPAVAARIQELFGLTATPRLAGGRVPLVIEILAPSRRPVQVTDDLESFWRRTYPEVRKQLRGRYPKHSWPESPQTAAPEGPKRQRR